MKLISVNIGLPRDATWHGRNVTTAIFKHSVEGRVAVATLNLDGDRQADLSGRTGFYFAVSQEGEVGAGDEISVASRDPEAVRVSEITRLYVAKAYDADDVALVRRALRVAALPESWKDHFRKRLREVRT